MRRVAEEIAGPIHIDVTYLVSAERGTTIKASSATAEIALAEFIMCVLEDQADAEHASADRLAERAAVPIAPGIVARPVEEVSAAQPAAETKRPYHNRERLSAENIQRMYDLRDTGQLTLKEIAMQLGVSKTSVEGYLRQRRHDAARAAPAGDG